MAYTTIDDPSAHFHIQLYTGNADANAITNDANAGDFAPDLIWMKNREISAAHGLYDSTRGTGTSKSLKSDEDAAEGDASGNMNLTAFSSDGFSLGATSGTNQINYADDGHVAWQWKANGGSTSSVSASGSGASQILASTHQANTTAGFSIILYTGTGATATVSHGLGAVPDVLLFKERSTVNNWYMYHSANTAAPETDYLVLDTTDATTDFLIWNDTAPTSTVCSLSNSGVHGDTETFVCYAWREIQGYSKFGGYTGNGNADGPFVYTGFKPAYLLYKNVDSVSNWVIRDNKRTTTGGTNPNGTVLLANGNNAESVNDSATVIDLLSNGFKIRNTENNDNTSGDNYLYMAFAEQPFVTSGGVPCTAK